MLYVSITISSNDNYIYKYIYKHIDFTEVIIFLNILKIPMVKKWRHTIYLHSLIHLIKDMRNLGNLNTINCFSFKNYLGKLKTLLRSSTNPHEQLSEYMKCHVCQKLIYLKLY